MRKLVLGLLVLQLGGCSGERILVAEPLLIVPSGRQFSRPLILPMGCKRPGILFELPQGAREDGRTLALANGAHVLLEAALVDGSNQSRRDLSQSSYVTLDRRRFLAVWSESLPRADYPVFTLKSTPELEIPSVRWRCVDGL